MPSCKIAHSYKSDPPELPADVMSAADAGFSRISSYFSKSKSIFSELESKELSNLILAHLYWNYPQIAFLYLHTLLMKQNNNGSFGDIRETARAVSCLFVSRSFLEVRAERLDNKDLSEARDSAVSYLLSRQSLWEDATNNIYDTVYALSALADAGLFCEEVCLDICENDNPGWQHPGTTALIITALQKQKNLGRFDEKTDFMVFEYVSKKIDYLLSVRKDGFWSYPATSCLVLQALLLCNRKDEASRSLSWLLSAQNEDGFWENNLNTTALALLTL